MHFLFETTFITHRECFQSARTSYCTDLEKVSIFSLRSTRKTSNYTTTLKSFTVRIISEESIRKNRQGRPYSTVVVI